MRHPVVITPLEEDLKAIGLLREQDDQEEPAPEPDPEGGYTSDQGDDKPTDEPDQGVAEQSDQEEPAPEPDPEGGYTNEQEDDDEDDDEDGDDETEAIDAIGTLAGHFIAQHQPIGDRPVGSMESRGKPAARSVNESKSQRVQRLAQGNIYGSTPKRGTAPTSRVSALLEEVSDIVGDIHRSRKEEQIKGFANIAVIADRLAGRFSDWGMALSEGNLYRVGAMMKKLSEDAADMAVQLDTPPGEEPPEDDDVEVDVAAEAEGPSDDAEINVLFKKFMAKLLDALQLYNDVTGKSEQDDDMLPGDEDDMPVGEMDDDPEGDDEDDAAENDPELDADDDEDPDMEGLPPGIKTSQADEPVDDEDDEDDEPVGEQDDDDEDDEEPESAIAEARKRLSAMKKKLTAQKGKKKVLKGAKGKKGKLNAGLPFVHTTKGKPGGKRKKR